jgi:Leucine-rich repeat (LRR) protein
MNGTLPAAVGNLSALTALTLSNNRFSGSVPAQFSRLSALQQMDLSNNKRCTARSPRRWQTSKN